MEHWCNKVLKLIKTSLVKFEYFFSNTLNDRNRISKLLSLNCAGWNPVKLCKNKQYSYIFKMNEKNEWNFKKEGENFYKKSLMKDSFKELYFFISPGLKYLGMNTKAKRRHYLQYINWLHSNTTIEKCTQS